MKTKHNDMLAKARYLQTRAKPKIVSCLTDDFTRIT